MGCDAMVCLCLCRRPCVIDSWVGGSTVEKVVWVLGWQKIVVVGEGEGKGAFPSIRGGFSCAGHSHGMMV